MKRTTRSSAYRLEQREISDWPLAHVDLRHLFVEHQLRSVTSLDLLGVAEHLFRNAFAWMVLQSSCWYGNSATRLETSGRQ